MGLPKSTVTLVPRILRMSGDGINYTLPPFFPSQEIDFMANTLNSHRQGHSSSPANTSADNTAQSLLPGQKAFEDAVVAFRRDMAKRDAEEKDILRELLGATSSDASTISSAQATDAGPSN